MIQQLVLVIQGNGILIVPNSFQKNNYEQRITE